MIHARSDYMGIQDPDRCTSIADDEPVFLLRGKDKLAPEVIRFWCNLLKERGGSIEDANSVLQFADDMVVWQIANDCKAQKFADECKIPDTPDGVRWTER